MQTRGSEDLLGAAERRVRDLERQLAERDRDMRLLEAKRRSIAGQLIAVQRRNSKLQAAQQLRADRVSFMKEGSGMWSKEVDVLVMMLERWDKRNLGLLTIRALHRITDNNGRRLSLGVHELSGGFLTNLKSQIEEDTLRASAKHLEEVVFKPLKGELLRLNCKISWNMLGWCVDTWKYDWSAVDKDGKPTRQRQMMLPGSKVPVPLPFHLKEMRKIEDAAVSETGGTVAHADRKGAEVKDVDRIILRAQEMAEANKTASASGAPDQPIAVLCTGDGAGLTDPESGVRAAVAIASQQQMNQSSHDIFNIVAYKAVSHAEAWHTLLSRLRGVRKALCRLWRTRQLQNPDGSPSQKFVKLVLSADKPFLMHCLGRRDQTHECFSPFCKGRDRQGGESQLFDFSHDPASYYGELSFEEHCTLALVPLWEALEEPEPEDWTVTDPIDGKVCLCPVLYLCVERRLYTLMKLLQVVISD